MISFSDQFTGNPDHWKKYDVKRKILHTGNTESLFISFVILAVKDTWIVNIVYYSIMP